MKRRSKQSSVSRSTVERDLQAFLQTRQALPEDFAENDPEPNIDLEGALKIFDRMRGPRTVAPGTSHEPQWTHPSVLALAEFDPPSAIIGRARRLVLKAIEEGWKGPPYDPFALAEMQGIKLLPTQKVLDAQTSSDSERRFTIAYNPQRPAARMRYSVAHEIGHTLFPDCAAATRNRATHEDMKDDDWQLESLCNIAAAEILMPAGTLQEELALRPSARLVLDLRRKYLVSCEAVVNRLIRLSPYPTLAFFARFDATRSRHFVEYCLKSATLHESPDIQRGYVLPRSSKAAECTQIGTTKQEDAQWVSSGQKWFIEYVAISPNPRETYPRVLALAFPPQMDEHTTAEALQFLKGDATDPVGAEMKLLVQVVNDQARIWGAGFAKQVRKKWPHAQASFHEWARQRGNLKLGNVHFVSLRPDLMLATLVAQHGFGKASSGPRIRYSALFSALEKAAADAKRHSAVVHMPRIGTGEAAGSWSIIEGIIREALIARNVPTTVYDLPSRRDDVPHQTALDLPLGFVDEVV